MPVALNVTFVPRTWPQPFSLTTLASYLIRVGQTRFGDRFES